MNSRAQYIIDKEKALEKFVRFHTERIGAPINTTVKLYFYQLPGELDFYMHNHFLLNEEMYVEDHGTLLIILHFLKINFAVDDIADADFIVFPFNLYSHSPLCEEILARCISDIRALSGNKRMILFSIGDFCLRPVERSTSFERTLFASLDNTNQMLPAWIRPDDVFICFESTLDFIHNDICIFPLISIDAADPFLTKKDFLFSFTGQYYKEDWPEGFVRSPSNKHIWEDLAKRYSSSMISTHVPTKEEAHQNKFYEIPKRSSFTLCPRGIASWSFRTFEAILSGSIPVILSDSYAKPFPEYISWDHFSLTIPEDLLGRVGEIISGIRKDVINDMYESLKKNQQWFTARGLLILMSQRLYQMKTEQNVSHEKFIEMQSSFIT